MASILTPLSLWKDFNDSADVVPVTLGEKCEDGIKYEYVMFSGRDTGAGRVSIYGVLASSEHNSSHDGVLIMPDSRATADESILKMFADNGYTALSVDYRGKWEGAERFTEYPDNIAYANVAQCGRRTDYADEGADKTSWYEWVAVGIFARKFLCEKLGVEEIGLVGIRDGGEIAWKLACARKFACAVTVCACGWKAYKGFGKFRDKEPELNEERYRFVAGIDSQSYAPYVKCPIMMLCSTNDPDFDYDRAYDTFSRINPEFAGGSVIAYSVKGNACINLHSLRDMFMFLDKSVKCRQVFLPKPAEISVSVDSDDNLIAHATFDNLGVIEKCGVYYAEECLDPTLRDWTVAPLKRTINISNAEFYLNIYEKTTVLFVLCYVSYSNGFTVWSKLAVKKISGKFRNSRAKNKVMYSSRYGNDCFSVSDFGRYSVGGIFLLDDEVLPQIVTGAKGLKGIYSVCGLTTFRLNSPQFSPNKDSILKLDVCPDNDMTLDISVTSKLSGDIYTVKLNLIGGVWQSEILESKFFKNESGAALPDFTEGISLNINGSDRYAVNNVIWL